MTAQAASRKWYREPWPWILMSGPAIVVVAGFATLVLAVRSNDGLVAEDYYKRGLAINRTLASEERARVLAVAATVRFDEHRVRVVLAATPFAPASLRLALVHNTRAQDDRVVLLGSVGDGIYEGALDPPRAGVWTVHLGDPSGEWRLAGRWRAAEPVLELKAGTP